MVRTLLIRGMLAGLLAGVLMFAAGRLIGEPAVERAIGFEAAMDEAKARADAAGGLQPVEEPELVSRATQSGIGLATGVIVYATAFGGLFALVFAAADRRIPPLGPRGTAGLLGIAGFVAVYLVPNLKYPANPPSIGQPDTIGQRTALYFIMIATSIAAMVAAAMLRDRLLRRLGGWNASIAAAAAYLVAVVCVGALLPPVNEVPDAFPAALLWQFRVASVALQAVMWATLALAFGALAERSRGGVPMRRLRFADGSSGGI